MQLLRVTAASSPDELPGSAIVCHDVRNPAQRSQVLARKGTLLDSDTIRQLLAQSASELHLALRDAGDVGEDDAATRIATILVNRAGANIIVDAAHFGQASLVSSKRGMLRVDADLLQRVNALDGVLVLTAEADRPVDRATTLGIVKCAPLFLPTRTIQAVQPLADASGPLLRVEPFTPMRVALLAPAERLRGAVLDRSRAALAHTLEWFGSSLDTVTAAEASSDAMARAYHQAAASGVNLIFAAGASATDPLDVVFDGLRQAGGAVIQIGIAAEPGTACWIGSIGRTPVLGLASCELFGRPGALDLLLPRLFAGEKLDVALVRDLALGGLLLGPTRIAPYHISNDVAQ